MTKVPKTKIDKKNEEIKHLDHATQAVINRLNRSDRRLKVVAFIILALLLTVGVVGILYQNHYALQNKNHIDCIIKDLSTPIPAGSKTRYIDYQTRLSADCKIKFN